MAIKPTLSDRIKQAVGEDSPSIVPKFHLPKDEPEAPDLLEAISDSRIRNRLLRLVTEAREYARAEKEAAKLRKPVIGEIKEIISEHSSVPKFMVDGSPVNYYSSTRKTLSRTKLLAAGVSSQILAECTDETTVYSLKIGGEEEEG